MRKDYYCHQKFLFEKESDNVNLLDFFVERDFNLQNYREPENLFDNGFICRFIKISELDSEIETKKDFEKLILKVKNIDSLVIVNDRKKVPNKIYENFSNRVLKSYIYWFGLFGIKCKWTL